MKLLPKPRNMKSGLYEILGVSKEATDEEIHASYIALAKKTHPDLNAGDDTEYRAIKTAYDILKDPNQRRMYDDFGLIPGEQESEVEQKALMALGQLFSQAISNIDPAQLVNVDIIGRMSSALSGELTNQKRALQGMESVLKNATKAMEVMTKRMKRKKERKGKNIFFLVIQKNIENVTGQIAAKRLEIAIVEKEIEILKEYEFEWDKPIQTMGQNYWQESPRPIWGLNGL